MIAASAAISAGAPLAGLRGHVRRGYGLWVALIAPTLNRALTAAAFVGAYVLAELATPRRPGDPAGDAEAAAAQRGTAAAAQ